MKKLGLTNMAAGLVASGLLVPEGSQPRAREKKEFTAFDQERLDKAQAKRERKAAKRLATV